MTIEPNSSHQHSTGVTGYIGGDALYELTQSFPNYEYSALIRTQEKADQVTKLFPNVRPVIGSLEDSNILEQEAAQADVVLHTADASDHEGAAKAISKGLLSGHTAAHPGFWLHTGGTGILTYFDTRDNRLGETSEKQFNDWAGVAELTNLPDEAFHRNIDKIVLETGTHPSQAVRSAIVCPPTIYGRGRGPVAKRSRQAYELTNLILRKSYAPIVGQGQARWNSVHVHDLSDLWKLLVSATASAPGNPELWGEKGYFLAENGEFVWGDLSRYIAKKAAEAGYIPTDFGEQQLSKEEAFAVADFQAVSWGLNSRGKAVRAREVLGWKPSRGSIEEEVPKMIREERERLGME